MLSSESMVASCSPACGCRSLRTAVFLLLLCIGSGTAALNTSSPSCSVPRAPQSLPLPTCPPSNKTLQDAAQGESRLGTLPGTNPCVAATLEPVGSSTAAHRCFLCIALHCSGVEVCAHPLQPSLGAVPPAIPRHLVQRLRRLLPGPPARQRQYLCLAVADPAGLAGVHGGVRSREGSHVSACLPCTVVCAGGLGSAATRWAPTATRAGATPPWPTPAA